MNPSVTTHDNTTKGAKKRPSCIELSDDYDDNDVLNKEELMGADKISYGVSVVFSVILR